MRVHTITRDNTLCPSFSDGTSDPTNDPTVREAIAAGCKLVEYEMSEHHTLWTYDGTEQSFCTPAEAARAYLGSVR